MLGSATAAAYSLCPQVSCCAMSSTSSPKTQPAPSARRRPTQSRSRHTVDAILEAALRVVADEGEERLSTNRIAERAGVSVGTLYQYFPTREAIVEEIAKRSRATVIERLEELLVRVERREMDPRPMLREFIGVYVAAFDGRGPGGPAFARLVWRGDHLGGMVHSAREASERIAQHLQRAQLGGMREPSPAQAFVLTRSLMGTVRAAVLEGSALLGSAAFEDELERMCWALLAQGPSARSGI